uniref:Uncharacterized protein n=1 Tax=Tetranychus urticae TaxID=32264 RepID=T1JYT2_TETUR
MAEGERKKGNDKKMTFGFHPFFNILLILKLNLICSVDFHLCTVNAEFIKCASTELIIESQDFEKEILIKGRRVKRGTGRKHFNILIDHSWCCCPVTFLLLHLRSNFHQARLNRNMRIIFEWKG